MGDDMYIHDIGIVSTEINKLPECRLGMGIWFAGCSMTPKCDGCHSPAMWTLDGAKLKRPKSLANKIDNLSEEFDSVLLYSGDEYCKHSIELINRLVPRRIIHLWTGREFDEIFKKCPELIKNIDFLKTGRYIEKYKKNDGILATSNQKVWHKIRHIEMEGVIIYDIYDYKYNKIDNCTFKYKGEIIYPRVYDYA